MGEHVSLYLRNYITFCICICSICIFCFFCCAPKTRSNWFCVATPHLPALPFALQSRRLPLFGFYFPVGLLIVFIQTFFVFLFFSVFSPNSFSFNFISLSAQTFQLIVQLFKRKQYRALPCPHKVWKVRTQVKTKSESESESKSQK